MVTDPKKIVEYAVQEAKAVVAEMLPEHQGTLMNQWAQAILLLAAEVEALRAERDNNRDKVARLESDLTAARAALKEIHEYMGGQSGGPGRWAHNRAEKALSLGTGEALAAVREAQAFLAWLDDAVLDFGDDVMRRMDAIRARLRAVFGENTSKGE